MLHRKDIKVFDVLPTLNTLFIQWNKLPVFGEFYNLYKSTSPESGFELVALNTRAGYYEDKEVNLFDRSKTYYYKLEVLDEDKKRVGTYGPERVVYKNYEGESRAIIREYEILINRVMRNPDYKLLLKKQSGLHCPVCYNEVTKRVSFPDCEKCNGTGIIEGYHKPINIKLSRDISASHGSNTMLDGNEVKLSNVSAWLLPYPKVTPGDVLVDSTNNRFRISSVSPRTYSHNLIRQIVDLTPLEYGNPVYNVEVSYE